MNAHVLEILHNGLKNFGLDPKDWKVQPLKGARFAVADAEDGQFYFYGDIDTTKEVPAWNKLVLTLF